MVLEVLGMVERVGWTGRGLDDTGQATDQTLASGVWTSFEPSLTLCIPYSSQHGRVQVYRRAIQKEAVGCAPLPPPCAVSNQVIMLASYVSD